MRFFCCCLRDLRPIFSKLELLPSAQNFQLKCILFIPVKE